MAAMYRSLVRTCVGGLRAASGTHVVGARRAKGRGWYYRALERMEDEAVAQAQPPFPSPPLHGRDRKKAFLDISMGGEPAGRLVLELADDVVPKTVENFINLCEGAGEGSQTYKGQPLNKVWKDFMILAGDFEGDGRGGNSSFGTKYFDDESFIGRHTVPGVVSMANAGRDTNSSMFFIAAKPMPHLDGRNVAFGHIVEGMDVVKRVEDTFTKNGQPVNEVVIEDCGELKQ